MSYPPQLHAQPTDGGGCEAQAARKRQRRAEGGTATTAAKPGNATPYRIVGKLGHDWRAVGLFKVRCTRCRMEIDGSQATSPIPVPTKCTEITL